MYYLVRTKDAYYLDVVLASHHVVTSLEYRWIEFIFFTVQIGNSLINKLLLEREALINEFSTFY